MKGSQSTKQFRSGDRMECQDRRFVVAIQRVASTRQIWRWSAHRGSELKVTHLTIDSQSSSPLPLSLAHDDAWLLGGQPGSFVHVPDSKDAAFAENKVYFRLKITSWFSGIIPDATVCDAQAWCPRPRTFASKDNNFPNGKAGHARPQRQTMHNIARPQLVRIHFLSP